MMLIVCFVMSMLSMGIAVSLAIKTNRLSKELVEAKRDFLGARSNTLLIDDEYWEARSTVKDMFGIVTSLKKDVANLSEQLEIHRREIEYSKVLIGELSDTVLTLNEDNKRLKNKLNIYDEVAPHCKLVSPLKTKL